MSHTKHVCAGLILKHGQVLIGKRPAGQNWAGFWEFPGGKCQPGESLQECLERELFEELRIWTRASGVLTRLSRRYPGGVIRLIAMRADIIAGRVRRAVHDELAWVSPAGILEYRLAPADRRLAEWLVRESLASSQVARLSASSAVPEGVL
ncbi:(deoxy)nucleoside triphosphate pyrophosphohydrolase [Marinimicrobium agarilyticum]|uniref:(deoxy)nucleoside triphosphate pyrophosphohydrolase n=1 Tax=Marinimicrobium agarilyticum TaxID=306546 RepID=UPI0004091CE2|nr:(deoxy)nucleoside triphosphate pyrophosphohydrolase [Marinimicrobium agarilyticum]